MARLALAGGTPVRTAPFPRWPDFDERERSLLLEALEARSWGGYPFPNAMAERFGSAFAAAHDARHAFAVVNGTVIGWGLAPDGTTRCLSWRLSP